MDMEEHLLLRVPEAAKQLSISRSKAYSLAARGELPGVMRVGKSIRVSATRLAEWIAAETSSAA
jgi:excisionase family DNA binding protein